jgi:predicted O-methyltransferase YrrM
MSAEPTLVTAQHFAYLAARTRQEGAFLKHLKAAAAAAGIPPIWICPEQASFMQILLQLAGAKNVLEVGTLAGYSAIAMARALPPGGKVTTLELLDQHAAFARDWVARSDVADRVEVRLGDAKRLLPDLPTASMDAAFLDADKSGYAEYLRHCLRIVRKGGLIMVDNAFAFGELLAERPKDRETPAVLAFNEIMAKTAELQGVIVPLGDGLWVAVKVSEP